MEERVLKKDNVDSLKKHIATLEAKIKRLEKENERLEFENKVLIGREDFVQEMYADYKALIDEIQDTKKKYLSAISETIEMRNEYKEKFERLLKSLRKR